MPLITRLASLFSGGIGVFCTLILMLCAPQRTEAEDYPAFSQPAFTENKGQYSPEVLFTAQTQSTTIWITTSGIVYDVRAFAQPIPMKFPAASVIQAHGLQQLTGDLHYYSGKRPVTGVHRYASILLPDVTPGIDMKWYFEDGNPRYDFIIRPQAKLEEFSFTIGNVDRVHVTSRGDLTMQVQGRQLEQKGLLAYQELQGRRNVVRCAFAVKNAGKGLWNIGFEVGKYNQNLALVIDPVVVGSFFGSVGNDKVNDIKVDEAGFIYIGGTTSAPGDLPSSQNRYPYNNQSKPSGPKLDGFVAKFSPEGKNLIYYCTLGGAGDDEIVSVALDKSGGILVGGHTSSDTTKGFPITVNAPDSMLNPGDVDGFVALIKDEGSRLQFSTYYGSNRPDSIKKIVFDAANGILYVAGITEGSILPEVQNESYGEQDGFYGAINLAANRIVYTRLLGGSRNDAITDMELFKGNLYLAGYTMSVDIAALNNTYVSGYDGFYSVVSQTGQLLYTHIYGGLGNDKVWGIAVDTDGDIIIAGSTSSPTLDVTSPTFSGAKIGGEDGFVAQFSPNSVMLFASIIGGSSDDEVFDVKVDKYGQIYLCGNTHGTMSVPKIASDADYTSPSGGAECFMTVINPRDPIVYNYLTYFGGSNNDFCRSMALASNHVYCAGFSNSNDFRPLGGYSSQYKGGLFDGYFAVLEVPSRKPSLLPTIVNFGKVTVNSAGKIDSIVVYNRSFKSLTVKSSTPAAPFTIIRPVGVVSINPADSAYIVYKFQPVKTGLSTANAPMQYGVAATDELAVRLTGEGIASSITIGSGQLDFGQVQVDSIKKLKISITNTGTAPGTLHYRPMQSIVFSYTSKIIPSDTVIQPGGQVQIEIAFSPTTTGIFTDSFIVESNAVPLKCILNGEGILSQFRWAADTVHIGSIRVGTTNQGIITLKNVGKAQGKITDAFLFGNKHFKLLPITYPKDSLINSGDSINFTVQFSPSVRGYETETIFANTPSGQLRTTITGKGIYPDLRLQTERKLDFGSVMVNSSKYDSVVFVNEGDDVDTMYSAKLSAVFTPFLLSIFPPRYVIAPNKKIVVYIKFSPLFPGDKRDTVLIDCATSSFTTVVTGVGIASQFKVTDTIRFGGTKVGAKATQTMYIKNTGTAAGLVGNIYLIDTTRSFSIVGTLKQDFELGKQDSSPITVQFSPTSIGLKTASLVVWADGKMYTTHLRGEANGAIFESFPREVKLDSAEVGSSTYGWVNVYNSGNITERPTVKIFNDAEGSFQISSVINAIKFRNKDSVQVRFTPKSAGIKTALLKIWGGVGDDTATVYLSAKGYVKSKPIPIEAVLSMPDSIFATVGEEVRYPVVLRSLTGTYADKIRSFSGNLRYNSTILGVKFPFDSALVISNDTGTLHIEGSMEQIQKGDTLALVTFTVGLGNSAVTSIELSDFTFTYVDNDRNDFTVKFPKSTLTVTDIWSIEGKQRLYYASGKLTLDLTPNTVQSAPILITCLPYLPSNTLMIYDATGRMVENLSAMLTGKGEISYLPQSLSKGAYFCVFQSGRHIAVRQFVVE
jgi:hypothetical protein